MTAFGIVAVIIILGLVGLCFNENKNSKYIMNLIGYIVVFIIF